MSKAMAAVLALALLTGLGCGAGVGINPGSNWTFNRAMDAYDEGNPQKAVNLYTDYIEANQKYPQDLAPAYHNRANIYFELDDWNAARADYDQAVDLAREYEKNDLLWKILRSRGSYFYDTGEIDLALADFTESIELHPNDPLCFELRAKIWSKKKQYERAEQDLTQARNLRKKGMGKK